VTNPDHDRAPAAIDAPDPVHGAEVVDVKVERLRPHRPSVVGAAAVESC